jgi:hypothetical protein
MMLLVQEQLVTMTVNTGLWNLVLVGTIVVHTFSPNGDGINENS